MPINLRLLQFVKREAESIWFKILFTSVISGLANGIVVVVVNSAIKNNYQFNVRYFILFAICISLYIIAFKYSSFQTALLSRNAIAKMHLHIADLVRDAELLAFENIGRTRISAVLAENTEIIFEAARMITATCSAVIMLFFTFCYIAYLSRIAFVMAIILIACAVFIYTRNRKFINELMAATMKEESAFSSTVNHMLEGFKEIKINRVKSDDIFHNYLSKISIRVNDLRIRTEERFLSNQIFANVFWYFLVAAIVFLLPRIGGIGNDRIMSITTVVLFIIGPISVVVSAVPLLVKADFSLDQLDILQKELEAAGDYGRTHPENPFADSSGERTIGFKNIVFVYPAPADQGSFSIGPINLSIKKGEILFLVGGNGSGKTTLLKVITGLYYPQQGTMLFDGLGVNKSNYQHYRNEMSVIFSDFHLFDRLYGIEDVDMERLKHALKEMSLLDKTAYIDNRFTNLNLSSGQKRRLALIIALMEDKPILVIDELAADLDPEFRKYFYEVILVELKTRGKTIIATSHDDRYFHVADRVVKMEYGRIIDGD